MVEDNLKSTRLAALKYLSLRALTSVELRGRLSGKGFASDDVETVIAEFERKRLLNDRDIADDVISASRQHRLEGRKMVRNRLLRRGIEPAGIEQKLIDNYTPQDEFAAALEFATKKQRSVSTYPAHIQRRRIGGALDRRGFSSDIIQHVLREILLTVRGDETLEDS